MKHIHTVFIIVISLLCAVHVSRADEIAAEREIRGISFTPMVPQIVQGTVRLDIPFSCLRINTEHNKEKFPITFFGADCLGKVPCFSLSFTVMIIPDTLRGYEEIVAKSKKEDFGAGRFDELPKELIARSDSGAAKTSLIFGNHLLSGNNVIGYYYNREKKITAKVVAGLVYMEKFSPEEWQYVLFKTFQILKSVKFEK